MMMNSHSSIPLKVGENYKKNFLIIRSLLTPIYLEKFSKEWDAKITIKVDFETFWEKVKKIETSNMERIQLRISILMITVIGQAKLQYQKDKEMLFLT